jgi:hypothetical protein
MQASAVIATVVYQTANAQGNAAAAGTAKALIDNQRPRIGRPVEN